MVGGRVSGGESGSKPNSAVEALRVTSQAHSLHPLPPLPHRGVVVWIKGPLGITTSTTGAATGSHSREGVGGKQPDAGQDSGGSKSSALWPGSLALDQLTPEGWGPPASKAASKAPAGDACSHFPFISLA